MTFRYLGEVRPPVKLSLEGVMFYFLGEWCLRGVGECNYRVPVYKSLEGVKVAMLDYQEMLILKSACELGDFSTGMREEG